MQSDLTASSGPKHYSLQSADFHSLREAFYTLFSYCYGLEVDQKVWNALAQIEDMAEEYQNYLGGMDSELAQEAANLIQTMQELAEADGSAYLLSLSRQYAANFLGVGPDTAPLCESHYKNDSHIGQNSPSIQVRRHYRRAGLAKSENFNEPEDHLSMELSLLAHLCARSRETASDNQYAARELLEWQMDFIQGHLMTWFPEFRDKVAQMSQGGFYAATANLASRFLELEQAWIGQSLQLVDFAQ